jgi:hypothetical protein
MFWRIPDKIIPKLITLGFQDSTTSSNSPSQPKLKAGSNISISDDNTISLNLDAKTKESLVTKDTLEKVVEEKLKEIKSNPKSEESEDEDLNTDLVKDYSEAKSE